MRVSKMTLSIMTVSILKVVNENMLSIITVSIMNISEMTLSIVTVSILKVVNEKTLSISA